MNSPTQTPTPTPTQTQDIHDSMTQIMNRMDTIERKLDLILHKLDANIIDSCDKMSKHIDFIDGVYASVKVPLNYISKKFHTIASPFGQTIELPDSASSMHHHDHAEMEMNEK